jgi:hypothetical protein
MMSGITAQHLTQRELDETLRTVDPAVVLVSPRVLRRVIRLDRRITTLGNQVPHGNCYALARDRLFEYVSRLELELNGSRDLPDIILLLERPDPHELETSSAAEVLFDYWRLLFHLRVHVELERRIAAGRLTEDDLLDRLRRIGSAEYAEVRTVLQRDDLLLPPRTDLATYVEFAAVFLELFYFAPELMAWHFPALEDMAAVADWLAADVDHAALHEATRLPGSSSKPLDFSAESTRTADTGTEREGTRDAAAEGEPGRSTAAGDGAEDPLRPSPPAYWRLIARAEKLGTLGNVVKAAILRHKATRLALPDRVQQTETLAQAELERLARRLQPVLALTEQEQKAWAAALAPVLQRADQGFRTTESRLLYDLQKVCIEHERGLFTVDLWVWCRSWGRMPLRRPLSLLREVMVAKHLQHAARQLTKSQLSGENRQRLSALIESAVAGTQGRVRERVRPVVAEILAAEGLQPRNVAERVAFRKIVEELLDRIVEHGYLSMGHLRDTLSQNQLKLPDLTRLGELLTGDLLLRVDRRLAEELDGVYRRGPIYLRLSHRLSALAFGTRFGRFLTWHVALPYGGAFLLVEWIGHMLHPSAAVAPQPLSLGEDAESVAEAAAPVESAVMPSSASEPGAASAAFPWKFLVIFLLGTLILLLIVHPGFRAGCWELLRKCGRAVRRLVYDFPMALLRWRWVRSFLDSPFYHACVGYLLKPLAFTACLLLPLYLLYGEIRLSRMAIAFLAVNLFLNSPVGRYVDELITEQLVRGWRELQMRVFAAGLRMIVDVFQWCLRAVEQLLYAVDEWLLFRTGERRLTLVGKALLGAVWAFINYVLRFSITLLIEPQVNPIKHFPVVTVSHKLLIAAGPIIVGQLTPYLGAARANTIVWSTIWLIPGIFGFLAWELKENWRLYTANRSKHLKPLRIGSHGETMLRLLRLGIHSGTIPRRFGKLRRAARHAARTGQWKAVHGHRAALQHVSQAIERFVDRELLALLAEGSAWRDTPLAISRIHLATNQILVDLQRRGAAAGPPLRLAFQERGGWILATLPQRGWLDEVPEPQREALGQAFRGLYKCAGVDLLWERVTKRLGPELYWYDVNSDGLLLWRDRRYHAAELCKLRDTGATAALPAPPHFVTEPNAEALDDILYRRTPLAWDEWVERWG